MPRIAALEPGKSGDAAECGQFDAFGEGNFILNSNKAENERLCLKCRIFT
jgi:hypothetical protein